MKTGVPSRVQKVAIEAGLNPMNDPFPFRDDSRGFVFGTGQARFVTVVQDEVVCYSQSPIVGLGVDPRLADGLWSECNVLQGYCRIISFICTVQSENGLLLARVVGDQVSDR